jgi:TonB family protein
MFSQSHLVDTGSRRGSLAVSAVLHLVLLIVVVVGSDVIADSARRVIRISGQDYDREDFEVTELVLPPDLAPLVPETPPGAPVAPPEVLGPDAVVIPVPEPPPPPEPEPPEEAQAAPPPPAPLPEPEAVPPPPVIGPDDVIAEGARPDAPPEAGEDRGNDVGRITLEEPGTPGRDGEEGDALDGEDGDSLDDGGDAPETVEAREGIAESEASPDSSEETAEGLLLPNLRDRARELAAESEERSRREAATGRRIGGTGSGVDTVPDFSTEEPTILSDTRGYDFGPYMNQVVNRVRVNWYSLIPEAARLRQVRGRVVIIFTITKNGNVEGQRIVANSEYQSLDNAAIGSIMASNPFPRIPDDFEGNSLVLQFTFLYNMQ